MPITGIRLIGFKGFQVAGIRDLTVTFGTDMQLIIGKIGSGKTRFLDECTVLPAQRPDYEPGGKKIVWGTHRGHSYELTSDMSRSGSPHSFLWDGEELNEGGGTPAQMDLIAERLGYTKQIDDIVHGRLRLTRMRDGERKTFLMDAYPSSLAFVQDEHKRISRLVKTYSNQLSHLYQRKAVLEAARLEPELLDELRSQASSLEKTIADIIQWHGQCTAYLETYRDAPPIEDVSKAIDTLRATTERIAGYTSPYTDYATYSKRVATDLTAYLSDRRVAMEAHYKLLSNQLSEVVYELDAKRSQLSETVDSDALNSSSRVIADCNSALESIPTVPEDHRAIPEDKIPSYREKATTLRAAEDVLSSMVDDLISSDEYARINARLATYRSMLNMEERNKAQAVSELQAALDKRKLDLSSIPVRDNCSQCVLFTTLKSRYDAIDADVARHTRGAERAERRIRRLRWVIERRGSTVANMTRAIPHLKVLATTIASTYELQSVLTLPTGKVVSLTEMLKVDIHRVSTYLERYVETSAHWHTRARLIEKKNAARALIEKSQSTNAESVVLQRDVARLDEVHTKLSAQVTDVARTLDGVSSDLAALSARLQRLESVDDAARAYADTISMIDRAYAKYQLEALCSDLVDYKSRCITRLAEATQSLRQQDSVEERYQQEIVGQIEVLETHLRKAKEVEHALAMVPNKCMANFLNAIVRKMNFYLDKVFSYPVRLALFPTDGQELSYVFACRMNGVPLKDIRTGSDGQRDMLDLAFILALISVRGLSDHPIYLDEVDKSLDHHHKHKLLDLLQYVLQHGLVSRMFLINHHTAVWSGFADAEILVLNSDGILTPPEYNTHATLVLG